MTRFPLPVRDALLGKQTIRECGQRSGARRSTAAVVTILFGMAWLWMAEATAAGSEPPLELSQHAARFQWRAGPGGEHWIYDGDLAVGAFYAGTEPMGSVARPVSLHDLRLLPGGPVFIRRGEGCGPLCLTWRKHLIFSMVIDVLEADDGDPERFRLHLKAHDVALRADQPKQPTYHPESVEEETWLELTYDRELPSYVFDVRTRLTLKPERQEAMLARDFRGLEFGDLLPAGANDRFPPRGHKKFPWLVYQGRDGRLYKLPQTHHLNQMHIQYAPDGFLAFVAEPDYNPVIQFVGRSGLNARSEVCWAMYDVHFKFIRDQQLQRLNTGKPLEVHYRVYSARESKARQWLAEAVLDPAIEEPPFRLPAFFPDRVNRFEPSDEYRVPSDCWFWRKSDGNCRWVWDEGFQSRGSLSIQRSSTTGRSVWQFDLIGPGYFPGFRLEGRYRVRARVRTQGVTGSVRLGWQMLSPSAQPEYSPALQGTTNWTLLELETSDAGKGRQAALRLIQEGAGQSWFDELEIVPIRQDG